MKEMIALARQMMTRAYAPYSKHRVGACVRTGDGRLFAGCNVENASLGLTVCAERSAVSAMISAGARSIEEVVIVASTGRVTPPCGGCRQVLAEFGKPTTRVTMIANGKRLSRTLSALLPHWFKLER